MKAVKIFFLVFLIIASLCAMNTSSVKSQASGTIYVKSNGSVSTSDNSMAPISTVDNATYTFTDNITDYSIVIQRDNIMVNGSGYTLGGPGTFAYVGIDLEYRRNVTISNTQIASGFDIGIYLLNSLSNTIVENNIVGIEYGIRLESASNSNIISANNLTNCSNGITIYSSSNNILKNNILNNNYNLAIYGTELSHFVNDIDISNTINGKKVYYLVGQSDVVINPSKFPDLGFLALVNCTNVVVQNQELAHNGQGVLVAFTTNSTITQNYITSNNVGVELCSSSGNIISGNNLILNVRGIHFGRSSRSNSVSANSITNNNNGIYLFESSQNTIKLNNITNSEIGIGFSASSTNMIYHNYFVSNTRQVYDSHIGDASVTLSVNSWDLGYPQGGNYWSDYTGVDAKSGASQDQPGSDGLGDTPYIIYEKNKDNYPLMPYGSRPAISILSPENKTYTVNYVPLTFTVSKPTSWIGYSLDKQANVTIAGNTTLTGLSYGSHSLKVYANANDTDGKTGTSETIYFTIAQTQPQPSEPFLIIWIVAATAIAAIGVAAVLVYFKKIKNPTRKVKK